MNEYDAGPKNDWSGQNVLVLTPTPTHPIDFGNRRRIYHVCRRLKDRGALVTILHYPAETDWRQEVPIESQKQMVAEWDGYYIAPTTRDLHAPPIEEYHKIDEWWDPSIGEMLDWLFRTNSFDVFIVNYAWLSRAFLHAKKGILKVLDTHDRFSGRRELLESHGIAPEFFYVTPAEEKIALDRADIVWAIKPEEAIFFKTLTSRPVLTLLHSEPVMGRTQSQLGDIVRFGIVGAKNNINLRNISAFLDTAVDYLRETLLPCEIVVAGSCCELLRNPGIRCIRFLGRVESIDEFYDQVDVVLGPMDFSTGLKIRIGEALSYGKAVIAHAHCFEGYVPMHRFQHLSSYWQMLEACDAVVRDTNLIHTLEDASVQSMHRANKLVATSLNETIAGHLEAVPSIVIVVPGICVGSASVVFDHAIEAAEYIGHQANVCFYIAGPMPRAITENFSRLRRLGAIICSPQARESLGSRFRGVVGNGARVLCFAHVVDMNNLAIWYAGIPEGLPERWKGRRMAAFVPLGILRWTTQDSNIVSFVRELSGNFRSVMTFDLEQSALLAAASSAAAIQHLIPCFWRGHFSTTVKIAQTQDKSLLTVLADNLLSPCFDLTMQVLATYGARRIEVVYDELLCERTSVLDISKRWNSATFTAMGEYFAIVQKRGSGSSAVIQLSENSAFSCIREVMNRACVPTIRLFDLALSTAQLSSELRWREAGVGASADLLADILADPERIDLMKHQRTLQFGYENDAGWTYVWESIKAIVQKSEDVAALSF